MAKAKKQVKKQKIAPTNKVISVLEILKRTWLELSSFWKPLVGITIVYAVLYFIFVLGLNVSSIVQTQIDETASRLGQAGSVIADAVFATYGSSQSDAAAIIQMLLFVIASLALIWALRKLQALKAITIRDSYYQGAAQIIPVLFVSVVLLFTMLPAILGSSIISVAIQAGGAQIEVLLIGVASGLLIFLSLLLFTMFWPAYYIASLPQTRPMQALKSALVVTKKRRLVIMRKLLFLAVMVLIFLALVMIPVALILPAAVPYVFYFVIFGVFLYTQVYLYELYRSLL